MHGSRPARPRVRRERPGRFRLVALLSFTAFGLASPRAAPGQDARPVDAAAAEAWRADLEQLSHVLRTGHGDVFHTIPESRFTAMVRELDARIPTLARHEIIVEMQRIVAAIGDGHTAVPLFFDQDVGFHRLPLRLGWYDEGIFVEAAAREAGIVPGARLVAIGGIPIDEAVARVTPLVSRDNDIWIRVMAPILLGSPEVLHAVGLSDDPSSAVLEVQREGEHREVRIAADPEPFVIDHGTGGMDALPPGWIHVRDVRGAPTPLWQRHPGVPYWYEHLAEEGVLYIQYNQVNDAPHGPGVHEFFASALSVMDEHPVQRVVLDIRSNSGGEGFLNTAVVRGLIRRPELQIPGSLIVIIGRRTFSAAQLLAYDLGRWTPAVFIGEPTGSSPQFWGDHRVAELANSGVDVSASPTWWQPGGPYDRRKFLPPLLAFEPRFADYAAGRDPAVEAALDWEAQQVHLDGPVLTAMAEGDISAIADAARAWEANPVHRYQPVTSELNRIGYRLMNDGRRDDAITLFRLNVEIHPTYANGWDSLGDVLLRAGRREEGLAAYRRAYELDPEVGNAAAVLGLRRGRGGQ